LNIVLVGFMGVGKTTIGRKLAVRLGYKFIDIDYQIEREQQCKITEIFAQHGEAHFRKLETCALERLIKVKNTIIATGGGILTTPGNMNIVRKIGKSVYLEASIDDIFERVSRNKKRPLLQTENPLKTITELYEKRKELYSQADININTNSMNMWKVVSLIIREL